MLAGCQRNTAVQECALTMLRQRHVEIAARPAPLTQMTKAPAQTTFVRLFAIPDFPAGYKCVAVLGK
jgi:hypothetical protein